MYETCRVYSLLSGNFNMYFPCVSVVVPKVTFSFTETVAPIRGSLFSSNTVPEIIRCADTGIAISQHNIKHTFLSSLCISYVGLQFKRINIVNSHEAFYTTSIHIICETNSRISSIFQLYHINLV